MCRKNTSPSVDNLPGKDYTSRKVKDIPPQDRKENLKKSTVLIDEQDRTARFRALSALRPNEKKNNFRDVAGSGKRPGKREKFLRECVPHGFLGRAVVPRSGHLLWKRKSRGCPGPPKARRQRPIKRASRQTFGCKKLWS